LYFPDNLSLLDYSLNLAKKDVLFLEFGVYSGKIVKFISSKIDCTVYGFDSLKDYLKIGEMVLKNVVSK
jgi:hypothetical protein